MADRISTALARAHEALAHFAPELVCKGIWGSPAGKTHLAQRIVAEIPEHRVYVEPFAGGAQVLFTKEPSKVEVVSDLDPEIAFAFRFAKSVTAEQLARLRRKKWVGDRAHFRKLYEAGPPDDDVERFYRFAYLIRFSFNKLRRGTMPDKNVGVEARFVDKLERLAPRLKAVRVRNADYEKVIEEYDGPDTFFFLDPPYAGHDADCRVGAGHKDWDEERFGQVLRKIRGKFLCTYGLRGDAELFKGFHVRRWRHTSGVGTSQGQGLRLGTTPVATNYDPDNLGAVQRPIVVLLGCTSTKRGAKGDRRKWILETQRLRVKWAGEPPIVGEHVVVEPVDRGGLVLTPSFEPLGSLVRALKRPRRDVVRATVGERPDTVDIEYLGRGHFGSRHGASTRTASRSTTTRCSAPDFRWRSTDARREHARGAIFPPAACPTRQSQPGALWC